MSNPTPENAFMVDGYVFETKSAGKSSTNILVFSLEGTKSNLICYYIYSDDTTNKTRVEIDRAILDNRLLRVKFGNSSSRPILKWYPDPIKIDEFVGPRIKKGVGSVARAQVRVAKKSASVFLVRMLIYSAVPSSTSYHHILMIPFDGIAPTNLGDRMGMVTLLTEAALNDGKHNISMNLLNEIT
jgi:hypothetical protein